MNLNINSLKITKTAAFIFLVLLIKLYFVNSETNYNHSINSSCCYHEKSLDVHFLSETISEEEHCAFEEALGTTCCSCKNKDNVPVSDTPFMVSISAKKVVSRLLSNITFTISSLDFLIQNSERGSPLNYDQEQSLSTFTTLQWRTIRILS